MACRLLVTGSVVPYVLPAGSLAAPGPMALICAQACPITMEKLICRAKSVDRPYEATLTAWFVRDGYVVFCMAVPYLYRF